MANYIESTLMPGEQVLHKGSISLWSCAALIVMTAFMTLAMLGSMPGGGPWLLFLALAAIPAIAAYIKVTSTELAITNRRLVAKFGFITRHTVEINISKIESIQVNQSVFGRLYNYGSLVISGAGAPQAPIPDVKDPLTFRTAAMQAQLTSSS